MVPDRAVEGPQSRIANNHQRLREHGAEICGGFGFPVLRLVGEHGSGVLDFLIAHQGFQVHGAACGQRAFQLRWTFWFVVKGDEEIRVVDAGFEGASLGIDRGCEGEFKPQGEQVILHGLTINRNRRLWNLSVRLFGDGEVFRFQQVLDVFVGEGLDFLRLVGAVAICIEAFQRKGCVHGVKIPADAQALDLVVGRHHDRGLHGGEEMRVGYGGSAG